MHATVTLSTGASDEQTEQNRAAQHWRGLLADISPEGAQVILPPDFEEYFKQDQQVDIRIKTILENIDFNVTAKIKYVIKSQVHNSVQIGVHFTELNSNPRAKYEIWRLIKYGDKLQTSTNTQS
jgi:hypothetical protein